MQRIWFIVSKCFQANMAFNAWPAGLLPLSLQGSYYSYWTIGCWRAIPRCLVSACSWVCTVAPIKCGRSFVFVLKSNALWSFLLAWRHLYWKSIATLVFCYSLAKIMSKLRKTKLIDTEWYWYIDSYWLTMFRWCLQRHCFSCFCWRWSALDWFIWPVPLLDASFEEDQGCAPSQALEPAQAKR